jgi:hypothetical protein
VFLDARAGRLIRRPIRANSDATFNGEIRAANDAPSRWVSVGRPNPRPVSSSGATLRLIAGPPGPERGTSGRAGERRGAARLRAALTGSEDDRDRDGG